MTSNNSGIPRLIPAFPVFWMRLKTKVSSPCDLVVDGTLNQCSFTQYLWREPFDI